MDWNKYWNQITDQLKYKRDPEQNVKEVNN